MRSLARPLARVIAPVLAALTIALAGGAPVLAAPGQAAQPFVMDLDEEWCFQDGYGGFLYCFDVDGKAVFQDNKAGSSVTITVREHTVITRNGAYVGESSVVQLIRGVYREDGTVVSHDVEVTRAAYDGQKCTYQVVFRIADYELVVDHVNSSCGG